MTRSIIAGLALVASMGAVQANEGMYIEAEVGGIRSGIDTTGLPGWNDTDGSFAGGVTIGYRAGENISVEANIRGYGDATFSGPVRVDGYPGTHRMTMNVSGSSVGMAVVGHLPVAPSHELYTKAGLYRWDLEAEATVEGFSGTATVEDDGVNLTLGAGYEYALNDTIRVGVGYDWLDGFGDEDAHLLSLRLKSYF